MSDPRANLGPPSLVPVPPERRATATGEEIIPVTAENLVAGKIPLAPSSTSSRRGLGRRRGLNG